MSGKRKISTRIVGGKVWDLDGFHEKEIYIKDGYIVNPKTGLDGVENGDEDILYTIDATGLYVIPALIDIHLHGAVGCDVCDASMESIAKIAEYEASQGIGAICPTTMTYPVNTLESILKSVKEYTEAVYKGAVDPEAPHKCADIIGINLEGPFINKARAGAQAPDSVIGGDVDVFNQLQDFAGGLIRLIDIAPECDDNLELIKRINGQVHISIAHTCADYETADRALEAGADHITHLYNAMNPMNHRQPGPIVAGIEREAFAEIITDGVHVHPAMVRLAFRMFGKEKMILVSDSMRACGLTDGVYDLGGQNVRVCGRRAELEEDSSTIAGSVTNLYECLKIAVKDMGLSLHDAVRAASYNPAKSIGIDDKYGLLNEGYKAKLLLVDDMLNIDRIMI